MHGFARMIRVPARRSPQWGGFVPGLSALYTAPQILAGAVIFGASQQLFTGVVARQAKSVLDKVGGRPHTAYRIGVVPPPAVQQVGDRDSFRLGQKRAKIHRRSLPANRRDFLMSPAFVMTV